MISKVLGDSDHSKVLVHALWTSQLQISIPADGGRWKGD